jgi:hypothetical protein
MLRKVEKLYQHKEKFIAMISKINIQAKLKYLSLNKLHIL